MKAMLLIPLEFSTLNGLELKISLPGIASDAEAFQRICISMFDGNFSGFPPWERWEGEPGFSTGAAVLGTMAIIVIKFLGVAKVGACRSSFWEGKGDFCPRQLDKLHILCDSLLGHAEALTGISL